MSESHVRSDAELVQAARDGCREAFAALVARYQKAVLAVCRSVTGDAHAGEDAAQDAFVAAYRNLGQLRRPAAFGPWLLRIARQKALRLAGRRPRPVPLDADLANRPASDPADVQPLLAALSRLSEPEAQVIALRFFEGHAVAAVAAILGRPVGTVTKQLSRAYARLRSILEEQ